MTETGYWRPDVSRRVVERIVVSCDLVLQEPAHFGGGDDSRETDAALLTTWRQGVGTLPLLPGSTLAGALRARLGRRMTAAEVATVFGPESADSAEAAQSDVVIDAALGSVPPDRGVELRTRTAIDSATGTAADKSLRTYPYWAAGTAFGVTIEATMTEENRAVVLKGLGTIIRIMEAGAMTLGSSRTRGHGRVQGTAWRLNRFELADPSALADWLLFEEPPDLCEDIIAAFPAYSSARSTEARIQMDLTLVDDLLVRDGLPSARGQIDTGQMLAAHGGKTVPVIPGASIAGAFRMRARRILELLCTDADLRAKIVRSVFGSEPGEGAGEARGSRVAFREAVLEGGVRDLVQTRLAIDRFTGGAFPGALFDELPVFGAGSARTKIVLTLSDCEDAEVGLLLLVCRDLATGDLPLGGTTSIGRGRFRGENIALEIGEVAHALDLSGESSEGEAEGQHYVDAFLNLIGAGV